MTIYCNSIENGELLRNTCNFLFVIQSKMRNNSNRMFILKRFLREKNRTEVIMLGLVEF